MDSTDRADIQDAFGLRNAQTQDKYLGLPILVGKNKKKTFSDIKERMWKKIRGWKSGLFSFSSKEVLIKAVAQGVPTYFMSIFQIPLGLYEDLRAMMSGFWWGTKDEKRKTSWILIGHGRPADKLLWHYDKKGTYEVKSGYRIAMNERTAEACSDHSINQRWWSRMWSFNISPKGLWQARNDAVNKNRKCHPEANLMEGVLGFLKDFQSSCCALQARSAVVKAPITWSPPQVGTLKLNSDASVRQGSHRCGVEAVIRDDKGWVVAAVSKSLAGNFSLEIGELIALREGLLLAKGLKLKISCVELDACNVVAMVSSGVGASSTSEFVCADVMVLCKEVEVRSCQSISRNGNRVAHNLASLAMSSKEDFLWQNVCLSSIFPCLVV
ncbi:hypothetical protein Dsin_005004 [Dipteronia sinensis]|uniref:RNase H type-1 domain-containing protein n=1 Tax=Dipteronia sinensis TaxID=43782 RepID=A0AAE0EES2_9ROSI|nr:hypothetical protein Dsin_005004 [Dipteronia sinensis]